MAALDPQSASRTQGILRSHSHRISLLRKLKPHKSSYEPTNFRYSFTNRPRPSATSSSQSLPGLSEPIPDTDVLAAFTGLHNDILDHVRTFYLAIGPEKRVSQAIIEHASAGIALPWPQILGLLGKANSNLATLSLCISWTILNRSLLVKLGTNSSPGSTFLPPEIVECFQGFSLGKGAISLGTKAISPVNFALLSRWKQISAALLHSTYVTDAFSFFDPRTVNVERALKDLDPLLATYAISEDSTQERIDDLRRVLRKGAEFAFILFGQPCFFKFDWQSDRAVAHGKVGAGLDPEETSTVENLDKGIISSETLTSSEIVIWPNLVRVMDGDGMKVMERDEGSVLGEKMYLSDFEDRCMWPGRAKR